ncbi:MAG TPA: ribonuclease P protein component [Anaeromyxobacteraceae bacterium]|nr:ribonuclease P protein component [Anaeromyxobacteraceae bacterium]
MRLGPVSRLRRRREFLAVQRRGKRLHVGPLVVLALRSGGSRARLGVTVSSKIANAVTRNRIKRWVREAFRGVAAGLPAVDVVVVARPGADRAGLAGARQALEAARGRLAAEGAP